IHSDLRQRMIPTAQQLAQQLDKSKQISPKQQQQAHALANQLNASLGKLNEIYAALARKLPQARPSGPKHSAGEWLTRALLQLQKSNSMQSSVAQRQKASASVKPAKGTSSTNSSATQQQIADSLARAIASKIRELMRQRSRGFSPEAPQESDSPLKQDASSPVLFAQAQKTPDGQQWLAFHKRKESTLKNTQPAVPSHYVKLVNAYFDIINKQYLNPKENKRTE
ncbi:MAG: hypothetical protein D6820_17085, partial [Lentisphaerae bacterium]